MKKLFKELLYIFIALVISFFIYRLITIKLLDYIPVSVNYQVPMYIATILIQSIFVYIIVKSIICKKIDNTSMKILWIQYFICLVFILFGRTWGVKGINFNIISSINDIIGNSYNVVIAIANLIMFVPMGYLLRKNKVGIALLMMLSIVIGVESMQYFLSLGIFDISDILLNMVGFYIGYVVCNKDLVKNIILFK